MGLVTFVGLLAVCALAAAVAAALSFIQKHAGKNQPKLL